MKIFISTKLGRSAAFAAAVGALALTGCGDDGGGNPGGGGGGGDATGSFT